MPRGRRGQAVEPTKSAMDQAVERGVGRAAPSPRRPVARDGHGGRDRGRGPGRAASRRTVGLPRFVVEELADHLADPADPEAFVFTAPQGGPLRVTGFRARVWRPATRAAGLEGLRIHDLRHTAVALWIAAGANPKEVAARAGHASVSFTLDRYGPCTRRPTPRSATGWTRCTAPPSRRPRAPSCACVDLPGVAPVWPQVLPRTTRAPPMCDRRRSDLLGCGVEVRGFEPLASSVRASWG
jgi:hypothetical protein